MRINALGWIAIGTGGLAAALLLAVGALYLATGGDWSVPATTANDPSLPVIEAAGYRFHGEIKGGEDEPVAIVLHGGPGNDYRYLLPLESLKDSYRVVFYDQRGAGLSPRVSAAQLTADIMVSDLDAIGNALSPGKSFTIIGHSWGAMLATLYIAAHPDRVDRAVLCEPGFYTHEQMLEWRAKTGMAGIPKLSLWAPMISAWARSLHVKGPDGQEGPDFLMGSVMNFPGPDHPLAGYYPGRDVRNASFVSWRFGALASSAVQASGIGPDGRLRDLAAGVESWKGRALFLSGSENAIVGPDWQEAYSIKRFARAEHVIIRGAGHTMIGEKPAESLAAIRAFLSKP
jgi:proline iminopeptidase